MQYLLSQEEYDDLLGVKAEFDIRFNMLTETLHHLKMISCRHMVGNIENCYCDEKCFVHRRGSQAIFHLCTKQKKWGK